MLGMIIITAVMMTIIMIIAPADVEELQALGVEAHRQLDAVDDHEEGHEPSCSIAYCSML